MKLFGTTSARMAAHAAVANGDRLLDGRVQSIVLRLAARPRTPRLTSTYTRAGRQIAPVGGQAFQTAEHSGGVICHPDSFRWQSGNFSATLSSSDLRSGIGWLGLAVAH